MNYPGAAGDIDEGSSRIGIFSDMEYIAGTIPVSITKYAKPP
jgi:hypothetical protein